MLTHLFTLRDGERFTVPHWDHGTIQAIQVQRDEPRLRFERSDGSPITPKEIFVLNGHSMFVAVVKDKEQGGPSCLDLMRP